MMDGWNLQDPVGPLSLTEAPIMARLLAVKTRLKPNSPPTKIDGSAGSDMVHTMSDL